jgi:hypothetical protein
MIIEPLHQPMKRHTIETIEPVERVCLVVVNWALKYYMKDSPFSPRDCFLPTLGLDGVDPVPPSQGEDTP